MFPFNQNAVLYFKKAIKIKLLCVLSSAKYKNGVNSCRQQVKVVGEDLSVSSKAQFPVAERALCRGSGQEAPGGGNRRQTHVTAALRLWQPPAAPLGGTSGARLAASANRSGQRPAGVRRREQRGRPVSAKDSLRSRYCLPIQITPFQTDLTNQSGFLSLTNQKWPLKPVRSTLVCFTKYPQLSQQTRHLRPGVSAADITYDETHSRVNVTAV